MAADGAKRRASLAQDRATLEAIGSIYCKAHHATGARTAPGDAGSERGDGPEGGKPAPLCPECAAVVRYAMSKTERCPYNHEGNCKDCSIHCYNADMRQFVRAMMRYAAPRMLMRHPFMTLRYLRKKIAAKR